MNILITGCDGYVGGHLAKTISKNGNNIYGTYLFSEEFIPENVIPIKCDIRKSAEVRNSVRISQPDIVYHFAAQASAGLSHKIPIETYKTNVIGTINLLDILFKDFPLSKFIYISSSEVYGNTGEKSVDEKFKINPLNPYGASKASAEIAVKQYFNSYKSDVIIIRPFPQLGAGQNRRFVIPSFAYQIIEAINDNRKVKIKVGNLKTVRSFIHIDDAIDCYIKLITHGVSGETYNLAGEKYYNLEELLKTMFKISNVDGEIIIDEKLLRRADIPYQIGSSDKVKKICDWKCKKKIDIALYDVLEKVKNEISTT